MDQRYSRQILFSPIGRGGQAKLGSSRVLLVGCGALGAAHAETLTRAGVGKLRIVDRDFVEFSNLQRQTLFTEHDAAERIPKAIAAEKRLSAINSTIEIEPVVADVTNSNIEDLVKDCDAVLDGTDNFQIRYLINDACVSSGIPWVYGAAVSSYGSSMTVLPGRTACLRCVFPEIPNAANLPTCDTAGVIMPVILTVSALQTTELLKILTDNLSDLHNSLIHIDLWSNDWRRIDAGERDPDCPACGLRRFEFLDAEAVEFSAVLCGRDAIQISSGRPQQIDLKALAEVLSRSGTVKQNEYLLRFAVDDKEITVFRDGRAIIKGTDDATTARSLYARYIGT